MMRHYLFPCAIVLSICFLSVPILSTSLTNITTDHSALVALKSHLFLDSSHSLSMNWSDSTSVCNWTGVSCGSRHQRVTSLHLSSMNLTGRIPPQIGNLSFLVSLDLSRNNFYDSMPQQLTQLRRLRVLDFSYNNLHGDILPWLSFLPALQYLHLRNNSFSGFIPPLLANMSNLQALDLRFNNIGGKIPKEMGDLLNLKMLHLGYNQLSDYIPSTLFNISTLERLYLTQNSLFGNLPGSMCDRLSRLEMLQFEDNDLSGEIPVNLTNCSRIRIFSLAYNQFSGTIPGGIGNLGRLETLYLGDNSLTGEIPDELGNMTALVELDIAWNHITGSITSKNLNISSLQYINIGRNNISGILPPDMCSHLNQLEAAFFQENNIYGPFPTRLYQCSSLRGLILSGNKLSGTLPPQIGNSTLLEVLFLTGNNLRGVIPHEIGYLFNLEELSSSETSFSGSIPSSLFNISTLRRLWLSGNKLEGDLPSDLGLWLPNLEQLYLHFNNLSSASPELSLMTSLSNCRKLTHLSLGQNPLNGVLPLSIVNLSTSLKYLYLHECGLRGSIPDEIDNLSNLVFLALFGNNLTGKLPTTLSNMKSLQEVSLYRNRITGTIPSTICELETLISLYLNDNQISGPVPTCIGNIRTLTNLDLSTNNLNSTIPASLWRIEHLQYINLSANYLTGPIPVEEGGLKSLNVIDFSLNQLSGIIPATIGNLHQLANLSLAHNRLQGPIPETTAEIVNLESLDLSHNNLSGTIPVSMQNLLHLNYLNVSFNGLSGEIPSGGSFTNFTSQSFMFNKGLCGEPRYNVTPCRKPIPAQGKRKWKLRLLFIVLGASMFLTVIVMLAYGIARARMKNKALDKSDVWSGPTQPRISYYELLDATDRFSETSLIGSGSFGSVYRGTLKNGNVVAVKVFHKQREGAFDSFEVECEVLRNLRHRNLCKVIGCCSNEDFKALILDYMPNGSLEKLLYSENFSLDLVQRISIMVDVASALEYLHCGYSTPIIHCDLKPSNILLDEDMVGHLCDFGLAKLLGDGETATQTITLATLGYIAPEFGTDGRVSVRCDVYSYGVTLMEVFTGMQPNDEAFTSDLSLRSWVNDSVGGAVVDIIDPSLIQAEEETTDLKLNCLRSVMELGLQCSSESPRDRITIKDVNASLKKIRNQLLLSPLRA